MTATILEIVLLAVVLGSALAAALLRDVLGSIIAFAGFSLGVSIIWLVLQAPDVGLTEAAVGAGIMTLLFLATIARTVRPSEDRTFERIRWRRAGVVAVLAGVLLTTLPALPVIGSPDAPVVEYRVTEYYLANAYAETGVENVVTAVLAAYRGFDTLGEAVVVFAAVVAVLVVLDREVFV